MRSDISMNAIKTRHTRDELLRYCPVWSAAAKKGRPKKHERRKTITLRNPLRRSAKEPTECIVLSVKNSTTTQRTAIKSKWREYRMTSTLIWALKVKNRRKTQRRLFEMKCKKY